MSILSPHCLRHHTVQGSTSHHPRCRTEPALFDQDAATHRQSAGRHIHVCPTSTPFQPRASRAQARKHPTAHRPAETETSPPSIRLEHRRKTGEQDTVQAARTSSFSRQVTPFSTWTSSCIHQKSSLLPPPAPAAPTTGSCRELVPVSHGYTQRSVGGPLSRSTKQTPIRISTSDPSPQCL